MIYYAKIAGNAVAAYPITDIRAELPATSFPDTITSDHLPPNYVEVACVPAPTAPFGQIAVEQTPTKVAGKWLQTWALRAMTAQETIGATIDMKRNTAIEVQRMLDAKAAERGFDGILSACTYATSTNPVFQAEGQACVEWRDACWEKCYEIMGAVQAGQRTMPTVNQIIDEMPAMTWPV